MKHQWWDVFYTTRSGQVECEKCRIKVKEGEDDDSMLARAAKAVKRRTDGRGTISHIGR